MGDSAMNTAVSALQAQSAALSVISQNLANSSTTGYKSVSTSFLDLVIQQGSGTAITAGGVRATTTQNVDSQGVIASASASTDMAVDGKGFFAVTAGLDGTDTEYTRDGEFATNSSGYLVLSGTDYYLKGWATDATGKVTSTNTSSVNSLTTINIGDYARSNGTPTTSYTLDANLPAEAQSDTSSYTAGFSTTMTVYDSLGTAQYVGVTFVPNGSNTWTMTVGDPTNSTGSTTTGTLTNTTSGDTYSYTVTFNSDGSLDTVTVPSGSDAVLTPSGSPEIDVGSWTDGASASTISTDLSSMTQVDSGETSPTLSVTSTSQDGIGAGTLSSVSISTAGVVTAKYSNGQSIPIYKIPLVTFANDDGLEAVSNNVYEQTSACGDPILSSAGSNGTGTIEGGDLENSTVDTSTQFSNMIVCQQAYSAAAQVISSDKTMFSALLDVVR